MRKMIFMTGVIMTCLLANAENFTPHKTPAHSGNIALVENGKPLACIVINKDAPVYEQHAAKELADYLFKISGAELPVVYEAPLNQPCVRVGQEQARIAGLGQELDSLGADGILVQSTPKGLILAGQGTRGTLYAVYTFLEDELGCRWWTDKACSIPNDKNIIVKPVNILYTPVFKARETHWFTAYAPDWAVQNKNNGHFCKLDDKHGGNVSFGPLFCHTSYTREVRDGKECYGGLISPDKYFEKHPEWFSLIDGKRTYTQIAKPDGNEIKMVAQLCFTNDEMRKELTKNLLEILRKNPGLGIVSVSQNDEYPGWAGNCQCPNCKASDQKYGGPSGTMVNFVNKVAADVEKEFPNVLVETLAYHYTRKAPNVKPRDNVIIRLSSIECASNRPFTDEWNKDFAADVQQWAKLAKQLYIWDYTTNFSNYPKPQPNVRAFAPNIRFMAANHVRGVFSQGDGFGRGGAMEAEKAWITAKLLWNPELDDKMLLKEFFDGYYGPAAKDMAEYFNFIHDAANQTGDKLICFQGMDAKFLNYHNIASGMLMLQKAAETVKNDPTLLFRVQVAMMPLQFVTIMKWDEFQKAARNDSIKWPFPDNIKILWLEFKKTADALGNFYLREGVAGYDEIEKHVSKAIQTQIGGNKTVHD